MKQKTKSYVLAVSSAAAGLCNALIGAGGGVVLSFVLLKLFSDKFDDKRNIYINSQAAMIPGCALSCLLYYMQGKLDVKGFSLLAIPAALGGMLGGMLLPRINAKWIKLVFALLVIWSGVRMMLY